MVTELLLHTDYICPKCGTTLFRRALHPDPHYDEVFHSYFAKECENDGKTFVVERVSTRAEVIHG